MLIKALIILGGIYFFYTRFIGRFQIPGAPKDHGQQDQQEEDSGEYVDYEEVD